MIGLNQGRRNILRAAGALLGTGLLSACGSAVAPAQQTIEPTARRRITAPVRSGENMLRVFASSGYGESSSRSELGLQRLTLAGFSVNNSEACFRRYTRFAGSDAQRAADLQDVAAGRAETPKVLMGFRGGYGAQRILPSVDWASLGSRMKERGTLLFGFSDVTAVQLALLAKSGMPSFAGPMLYSEFAKPQPSSYTMQSFAHNTTQPEITVEVGEIQSRDVRADGILWGGNLSVLSALAGSPYMPDISGGILFLEDVGEQPYRIERMLQTLYLSGVLGRQQAVVLGNFRMGNIRDVYDPGYTLGSVIQAVSRAAKVPILTGFPFGHIADKTTFPLGAQAQLRPTSGGGYRITFTNYPTLDAGSLNLAALQPTFWSETAESAAAPENTDSEPTE